jgi:hypothetical protein
VSLRCATQDSVTIGRHWDDRIVLGPEVDAQLSSQRRPQPRVAHAYAKLTFTESLHAASTELVLLSRDSMIYFGTTSAETIRFLVGPHIPASLRAGIITRMTSDSHEPHPSSLRCTRTSIVTLMEQSASLQSARQAVTRSDFSDQRRKHTHQPPQCLGALWRKAARASGASKPASTQSSLPENHFYVHQSPNKNKITVRPPDPRKASLANASGPSPRPPVITSGA